MTRTLPSFLTGFLALGLALISPAQAQQRTPNRGCGTTENNEAMQQELERRIPGYNRNAVPVAPAGLARALAVAQDYRIPIVFHVVHNGEAVGTGSNISDARILEQLTRLNEDFAKLNTDRTGIPAAFQPVHADVQVQFAMAQRDLSNNCFNGINRIDRTSKSWTAPPYTSTYCNSTIKPQSSWDPARYLNFWVVDLGGGLLGFAQFPDNTAGLGGLPASGGAANTDGVVCLYSAVGNGDVSAAPYNLGRTATHEVGHWLGLRHIWGDAACGTDYVTDTPTQNTSNYGCPAFPFVTCTNGPNGDMFMNYMDYTDDACMFMFSTGQKDRVQAVMAVNTPRRTSLATSPALPPVVAYNALTSTPLLCAGGTISLAGTAPAGYTYSWTGPNGFSSTQQNPSLSGVTTAASGTYTMTVAPMGGCPVSDNVEVVVRPISAAPTLATSSSSTCSGTAVTLTATPTGNQTASILNQNWNVGTTEGGWTRDNTGPAKVRNPPVWATDVTTPGIDGTRFIKVADVTTGQSFTSSALFSPVFSAANLASLSLSFQHIFQASTATTDFGKLEISTGGGTWATLRTYTINQSSATVTVDLLAYLGQTNLQLRWHFRSGGGGSWSVDNIAVTGAILNTYAWSVLSGNGLPPSPGSGNTLVVTPTQSSVYQVTLTAPGSCSSVGTIISIAVPTTTNWTGTAGNGSWTDAGNWTNCVPTRNSTVNIPNGLATPYPALGAGSAAEAGNLVQNGPITLNGGTLSLFGDHTGTGAFSHTGGTFVVAGPAGQSLRGLAYGALNVSGNGLKALAADATASAAVTLNGGLLVTGPNTLTLNGAASLTETLTSYVLGRVSTSATLAAGGGSTFRGLGLNITVPAAGVSPGSTTALRVTGTRLSNPAVPTYQSISRYYDITPTLNAGLNLTLTLSYNATTDLNNLVENRLVVYRSLNTAGPFERMASSLNTTAGTATVTNVNHLSVWTLGDANAPLPVELTAFDAAAVGPDARLTWTTASEKNSAYFEVQVSTSGAEFQSVGRVEGQGHSNSARQYALTDANVARYHAARLYYRLRQVDQDGTVAFSPVRTLGLSKGPEASFGARVYPNPSAAEVAPALWLTGAAGALTLTLHDAMGRVLSQREVAFAGAGALPLPEAHGLPAGLYMLEVRQGTRRVAVKLLRD